MRENDGKEQHVILSSDDLGGVKEFRNTDILKSSSAAINGN